MDWKKTNCHSTFSYPLSYQSLITMVLQRLISSYKGGKKKRIFFGPHLPNPKDIYFFIEELLTTVILHPIGSLKVYKTWLQWQTNLQHVTREIYRSENSKHWIFSVNVPAPENRRTIFLALQFVPIQACKFTQKARQSQSNLKMSQSFSLFPWPNLLLIFTAHSSFFRMLCLKFFMRWFSWEKRHAML